MTYYLTSLRKENFDILKDNNFSLIGFSESSHIADSLLRGDYIIIYIGSRKSKIAGYIEVLDSVYWDNTIIWDDVFPKRVKIRPRCILSHDKQIDIRKHINELEFVSNKERYGMSFMSGLRKISDNDGKYLINIIEREMNNGI